MAQTLTNLNLEQTISATVDSGVEVGLNTTHTVGGTNTIPLTTTDADIIYTFKITFDSSDDVVTWQLNSGAVTQTTGTGAAIKGAGATTFDVLGDALPTMTNVVAIYYETPDAPNANAQWVRANGSTDELGDIKLLSGYSRSAMFYFKSFNVGSNNVVFSCGGAATITVVCLAKD
tara:strand:- start:13492 stop:14016 length:525 start_codon:yes stop_codon:yes gene_type:complete